MAWPMFAVLGGGLALMFASTPTPKKKRTRTVSKGRTRAEGPPSPQPSPPPGWQRYQGTPSPAMVEAAKAQLGSPLGTFTEHESFGVLTEWHYHPPGAAGPDGWHLGSTIYVSGD